MYVCMCKCEKHEAIGYETRDGTLRRAGVVLSRDGKRGEVVDYIQHGSRRGFMDRKKQGELGGRQGRTLRKIRTSIM